jgi:membrane protease YdiL (CAAX protease family)
VAEYLSTVNAPTDELAAPPRPTALARPSPGILGAVGWCFVFMFCQLIAAYPAGLLFAVAGFDLRIPVLFGGQVLGAGLAVLVLWRRLGRSWVSELGVNRLPLVPTLLAVLCVPGLYALCTGIALLMEALLGTQDQIVEVLKLAVTMPWWLAVLALAVGPALNEELWFRGFLGRGLLGRYGPTVGIILTSLLFGIVHFSPIQSVYAVVLGLGVHLIYRATRSLWAPILVHFLFNASTVAVMFLTGGAEPFLGTTELVINGVIGTVSLAVLAAAGWGLYRLRARVVEATN